MTARPDRRWSPDQLKPHGTPAAARRHYRLGEPLCFECKVGQRVARGDYRPGYDPRPVRNNIPPTPVYQYRARRYPYAEQALRRAEALFGRPASEAS